MFQARQGDLLITRTGNVSSKVRPSEEGKVVLLRGEKTGHTHVVDGAKVAYETDAWGQFVTKLHVLEDTEITHEEHDPIPLKPGVYEITRQRRFDYKELGTRSQAAFD